tara:strand:- start:603 stop:1289 length:687 start_codon:yes stop_codon:yes gene_type:complete
MAVSVDTVYQRVLAILNKEQRGYLTPAEYNLFANQAQLDIFEQYFYDLNQFSRLPGNSTEYSDMVDILEEKISIFETFGSTTYANDYWPEPTDLYRLGSVVYNGSEVEHVNKNEYLYVTSSPLSKPTNDFPIYTRDTSGIKVYGTSEITTGVTFQYVKKPAKAIWNYTEVNGEALYDANGAVDFELHEAEETDLVIKILQLAGVLIKDPSVYQIGSTEEAKDVQQEKA